MKGYRPCYTCTYKAVCGRGVKKFIPEQIIICYYAQRHNYYLQIDNNLVSLGDSK